MTTLEIILSIVIVLLLIWLKVEKRYGKLCWQNWDYFEGKYNSLYKAYIAKLTPDELARIQDISINKDRDDWDLKPRLEKPI